MLSTTTYAILWEPAHLQSGTVSPAPPTYNTLLERFFRDVGGHGLYTDLTQYYQVVAGSKQYIQNLSTLGGAVVDTTPYPKADAQCGAETNCIGQPQLQAEIQHDMALHGWTAGLGHAFFIFTLPGEDTCDSGGCAYSPTNGYCQTHYNAAVAGTQLIYSVLPYVRSDCYNYQGSSTTPLPTPNNNQSIDGQIDGAAHELMESVTDPTGTSWLDSAGNEIADKCQAAYTPLTWDTGKANQMWNGNFYMVQDMFDNHNVSCVQEGP